MAEQLLDVIGVDSGTQKVLWVKEGLDEKNADAVVDMAVMRQGVEDRFFVAVTHGDYKAGDTWEGHKGTTDDF